MRLVSRHRYSRSRVSALTSHSPAGPSSFDAPGHSPNTTYLIYLPLRNAPETLSLQLDRPASSICAGCAADSAPRFASPPVLWYGTSIQQGGVASRAGNAYDAVISRVMGWGRRPC